MTCVYGRFGDKIEDYKVFSVLGKGGFATVYKAVCLKTNLDVAIKIIDKKVMHSSGMVSRVRQEVSIHSRLKHPSILELHTFFEDTDYVYIILELAHNGELQKYIKENNIVMTETEAANVMKQVVAGLLYLHSHQIVHRDITLSNLLLTKDMTVKIGDFGLAIQLLKPDEKHMTMCGTPNYISPEIASRASHGMPADVWSLGCMLYTLLVGVPPFDTDGIKSTLTKIVMTDVHLPTWLPADAKDLISQLLRKNPVERIKLENILSHSFMIKTSQSHASIDSGFDTMTTSNTIQQSYSNSTPLSQIKENQNSFNKIRDNSPIQFLQQNYQSSSGSENRFSPPSTFTEMFQTPVSTLTRQLRVACNVETPKYVKFNSAEPFQLASETQRDNNGAQWSHNARDLYRTPQSSNHKSNSQEHHHLQLLGEIKQQPVEKLSVPPLNTKRLLPTRHKTKTAIMSILDSGEVVIEFIKYRNRFGEDRVVDVCRISSDGLRIVLYQPNNGRGATICEIPQDLPILGADSIFNYETLPQKHWKKYMYAARFTQLVRAKTPKVTYFSVHAKCVLMETLDDFEMIFYNGGKLTKSQAEGVKVSEYKDEVTKSQIMEHFEQCFNHCKNIEKCLSALEVDSQNCFPAVIGKKPKSTVLMAQHLKLQENSNNFCTPRSATPVAAISLIGIPKPTTSLHMMNSELHSIKQSVPNVEAINQYLSGGIDIKYADGHTLNYTPYQEYNGFVYTQNGFTKKYAQYDEMPKIVRERVEYLPLLTKLLSSSNDNFKTPNDNNVKCIR